MTLLQKIEDCIRLGYNIYFGYQSSHVSIIVSRDIDNYSYKKESWLPLSDHFYEEKIVDCIDYMVTEIQKRNK